MAIHSSSVRREGKPYRDSVLLCFYVHITAQDFLPLSKIFYTFFFLFHFLRDSWNQKIQKKKNETISNIIYDYHCNSVTKTISCQRHRNFQRDLHRQKTKAASKTSPTSKQAVYFLIYQFYLILSYVTSVNSSWVA